MRNLSNGILYVIILLFLGVLSSACTDCSSTKSGRSGERQFKTTRNILFVSSHHESHRKSREVIRAIKQKFKEAGYDDRMMVCCLDVKSLKDTVAYKKNMEERIRRMVYQNIDLVVALDKEACEMVCDLDLIREKKLPVLCCTTLPYEKSPDDDHIFACHGEINYAQLYQLALQLMPSLKEIYLLTDHTESGREQSALAQSQLAGYQDQVKIHFRVGENQAIDHLLETLSHIPPHSLVIAGHWRYDSDGIYRDPDIYNPLFAQLCSVPLMSVTDAGMGAGLLGGYIVPTEIQGGMIGTELLRLLEGESIGSLRKYVIPGVPVFDVAALSRWNLSQDNLPSESILINRAADGSFWFKQVLWNMLLVFVFLGLLVLSISYFFRYRKFKRLNEKCNQEKKEIKREQKQRQEVFTNALSTIKEGIIIVDRECRIIDINAFAYERLNCVWDVIGRPFNEVCEMGGSPKNGESLLHATFKKVMSSGQKLELRDDTVLVTTQGNICYIEGTIFPILNGNQQVEGAIMVAWDIVDEVRQKNYLNMSIKTLRFYTWYVNIEKDLWEFGPEFAEIGGREEELNSLEKFVQHVHPDDRDGLRRELEEVLTYDKEEATAAYRIDFAQKGEYSWWESYIRKESMILPNGYEYHYLYGICVSIDKHKQVENRLNETIALVEDANHRKTLFLDNMTHEIRTLLNGIIGFTNLMCDDSITPEERSSYQSMVYQNNDLLLELLDGVLKYNRIQVGHVMAVKQDCVVDALLNTIIETQSGRLPEGVTLVKGEIPENLVIETDVLRLTEVFSNLIQHAGYYSRKGEIELSIKIVDKKWIEFAVADHGDGIGQEHLSQLFERFYKIDEKAPGTGLELAICKAIVTLLGGTIWATSGVEKGTVIYFRLPYAIEEPEIETIMIEEQPKEEEEVKVPTIAQEEKRLLVAEDTDSNYLLLKALLKKEYVLERAHDGEEAVEMFKANRYDAILMDMKMPRKDGIEATIEIRKYSAIPIIAQTAYAFETDRQRCIDAGCTDFISKPIKPDELHRILKKYL